MNVATAADATNPELTDLYGRVQHFYAVQMQALDDRRFDRYAATFTADGRFQHTPGTPAAEGRAAIVDVLVEFHRRFDDDPVRRRHWFNHIVLEPRDDGAFDSTVYALVVTVRPGAKHPDIGPSCVVHDVLELRDGELLMRSRQVDHDHAF
jgi:actinorhodin biosynthesis protein ActVIA